MLVKLARCCVFCFLVVFCYIGFCSFFDNLLCGYSYVGDIESNWMNGW